MVGTMITSDLRRFFPRFKFPLALAEPLQFLPGYWFVGRVAQKQQVTGYEADSQNKEDPSDKWHVATLHSFRR